MNKNYIYRLLTAIFVVCLFCSCDDFLDDMPDNRTQLNTPEKVQGLMVTSYPLGNYSVLAEYSSDNFVDNQAPNANGISYNVSAIDRMDDEIFAWGEITTSAGYDSPYVIWESFYQSIASANHAIEAIEKMEARNPLDFTPKQHKILSATKGEALILRAYCHFILVNIFGKTYKDAEISKKDLGIAYVTEPATEVGAKYKRLSVAEVYEKIDEDIQAGIDLVDNSTYTVPKYHFNEGAACAFAARFYLYKRDYDNVIKYANRVLGNSPESQLRDWTQNYSSPDVMAYAYINMEESANLLMVSTISFFARRFNYRYGSNGTALLGSINDAGPTWGGGPSFLNGWLWTYNPNYGNFIPKIFEFFEYSDKVAQIGYPRVVRTEFTTDALLLDRAEAHIFKGDLGSALKDLQAWNKSHLMKRNGVPVELTATIINNFYTSNNPNFSKEFHTTELSPEFIVSKEQKPFVDCVLHFRRLERIYEGDRWFDLKRYGIEVTHYIGRGNIKKVLTYDDDRRAIQIPVDVIGAGVEPNPRISDKGKNFQKDAILYKWFKVEE
ncbi:RagB/SusD family nutrient uptake outer membrane protein [Dysgonomonas sp. 520]|uniref:RagB/SusD family nutrient uptake outer membrane protein n=1 Tax=Dysgonomonas sp. 520 TaxID=2302931 RepID=UPI0013D14F68|nr:RagB/SusD family nutrient uptake outer membrane protein [Dysgonomonas sp. 520]